jgi:hypothetical protein
MTCFDPRAPALLISTAYLARLAETTHATTTTTEVLLIDITPGSSDRSEGGCVRRLADAEPVPALRRVVACTTDAVARARLVAAHAGTVSLLPDAGHPAALWRAAERLGLCGWLDSPSDPTCAALVLSRLAEAAGLVGPGRVATDRLSAALELLVACLGGGHGDGPAALRDAALRAGLWPRPAMGPGLLLPAALGGRERAALHGVVGAETVFREAAAALRDHGPAGLLPAPSPRPALLGAVPPSSDQAEATMLEHFRSLAEPLPLLPAPDPVTVQARLLAEFPWMGDAIRALVRDVALRSYGDGAAQFPPTLLVGPPGVGKTRFARVIAETCGLPWRRLVVADGAAVTTLTGNGRGWRGARPCWAAATIAETGVLNPLLVVDDIDRAATDDRYGTPSGFLLSQLERDSAARHLDSFLLAPVDVSAVSWILTANNTAGLPGALLDRVLSLEVGPPPPSAIEGLIRSILADIATEVGASGVDALPALPSSAVELLRQAVVSGDASIRMLSRAIRRALGAVIVGDDPMGLIRADLDLARSRDDRTYVGGRIGFRVGRREAGP